MRVGFEALFRSGGWLVAVALILGGCAPVAPARLRIGFEPSPGYDLLLVARDLGAFRAAGVNVDLLTSGSSAETRKAWNEGRIDAMAASAVELSLARLESPRRAQAFYVLDSRDGADALVTSAGGQAPSDSSREPHGVVELLLADSAYIHTHAVALARVVAACEHARAWAVAHPDSTAARVAALEHIPLRDAVTILAGIHRVELGAQWGWLGREGTLPGLIERTRALMRSMGRPVARDTVIDMVTTRALPPEASP